MISSFLIYCDGACSGNPGPGGWAAIVATPDQQVRELGGFQFETTNNQMELTAAIEALESVAQNPGPIVLNTDSTYVIRGITQWIFGWRRNGWRTAEGKEVLNRPLWEKLLAVVNKRGKENPITWNYVRGHSGIPGNERVDALAVSYSQNRPLDLFEGPLKDYPISLESSVTSSLPPSVKPKSKSASFSYLSLIGDQWRRHATWEECKQRVHGVRGAKFKKATSAQDEEKILKEWGVRK